MSGRLYFEDLEVGHVIATQGRTITEADIVNFAGVSGDYNPIHVDAEHAAVTHFGKRVAHGVLGLAIATGQAYLTGLLAHSIVAFSGLEWKFRAPVYIGDTIRTELKISKKRELPGANGGMVVMAIEVINQQGEVVQAGTWNVIIANRPVES